MDLRGAKEVSIIISLVLNSVALIITSKIVPGFTVADLPSAILAAVVLGAINTFIRPVLAILTAPINFLTLGLFTFVLNAIMLKLTALFIPGMVIDGWVPAVLAAIVLSIVSTALSMLLKDIAKASRKR